MRSLVARYPLAALCAVREGTRELLLFGGGGKWVKRGCGGVAIINRFQREAIHSFVSKLPAMQRGWGFGLFGVNV